MTIHNGDDNAGHSNSAYIIDCYDINGKEICINKDQEFSKNIGHPSTIYTSECYEINAKDICNSKDKKFTENLDNYEKSTEQEEIEGIETSVDADIAESPITFKNKLYGTLFALAAAIFYVIEYTLLQYLKNIYVTEVVFAFMVVMLVLVIPLVLWKRTFWSEFKDNALPMILFGCFASIKTILLNIAFTELPVGDASSIIYSSPVFVIILAYVFLKERITWFRGGFVVFVLVGVILVVHPPVIFGSMFPSEGHETYSLKGYLCALGTSFLTACEATTLRKLKGVYFANKILVYIIVCLMVMYASFPFVRLALPTSNKEWIILAATGCVLFVAVIFLNLAFQNQEASVVSVIRCSEVVLSFIVQIVLFHVATVWITYVGAALILLSAAFIALEKLIKRILRKYFKVCKSNKQAHDFNSSIKSKRVSLNGIYDEETNSYI